MPTDHPAQDPLLGLRDYQLPPAPPWWPPAPGWWLLAGLALAVLAIAIWRRARRRQTTTAAGLAARELAALRATYAADGDGLAYLRGLSQLLRRLALARYPQAAPAGLTGARWLAFLASHRAQVSGDHAAHRVQQRGPGDPAPDAGGIGDEDLGRGLIEAPYRPVLSVDVEAVAHWVADWVAAQQDPSRAAAAGAECQARRAPAP